MIPLEKLIPIEAKAREYGYSTSIHDGGNYVRFSKYVSQEQSHAIHYENNEIKLWYPHIYNVTVDQFDKYVGEQNQLLELAIMLQENAIEEPIEKE